LVGIVQFTRLLLRTADESPRADRVLAVLVAAAVVLGATSLVFPHTLNEAFIAPFGMFMVISAFVVGVQRARQGSTAARYFVAAWVAPACGATLYVLKHTTFVPHTAFTEHAFQVGSALEMLLFSLALADRVRTLDRAIREKELRLALADVEHERALDVMRADAAARMVEVQEEHSRRLARDLHDSVGHRFLLIEYAAANPDEIEARAAIVALAREGAAETRDIAHGLYPQRLLDLGLAAALRSAADVVTRAGLQGVVEIDDNAVARLGSAERLAVLRVAEEALHNALRHGRPTTVSVRLATSDDMVVLEVADDGVGIAEGAVDGLGMRTMRERAFLIDARLTASPHTPRGTVVRMTISTASARRC
jgi:signal transduction histidine kinase